MDTNSKSNKNNDEFNDSKAYGNNDIKNSDIRSNNTKNNKIENDDNINKNNSNKSKGIIAALLIIAIIVTAALGMCSSYKTIDKMALGMNVNYFEQNQIAHIIAESSYALEYESLKENENQKPSDILLDIKNDNSNNSNNDYEEEYYYKESLENTINQFNSEYLGWINGATYGNLNYYYNNNLNNKTNISLNGNVSIKNGNVDLSELNKDYYQFYAVVNFDNNGNVNVSESFGVDKEILKANIEDEIASIRNEYSHSYGDNYEGKYDVNVNLIKDMTFVYAVPKVLNAYDSIRWGIDRVDTIRYEGLGIGFAFMIAGIIALAALIFPIKKAKNTILFRGISKIPFEIWIIIIGLVIAALGPLSGQLVRATANGDLQLIFTELIPDFIIPDNVIWLCNFGVWFLSYGAVFFFILVLKYIFNIGFINYLKRRTIAGRIIMFFIRLIRRILNEITSVDLREKNNKLIIKLLVINAIILLVITSIWFFGIPVVILYSIILFFVIRKYMDKICEKYNKLREATSKIAKGNLDVKIDEDLGLFEPFKEDLEKIQGGFKKAVDEEVKSQKMKTDLISNVSHDLKTPLTAIITYADLLKDENLPEEKRIQYIEILDKKAQRLQVLIEDLFEMSKASSGNITLNIADVDVVSLVKQTLLELDDKLKESNLTVRINLPEEKIVLPLDGERTFRAFENLVINMSKYAMPGTRVFVDMVEHEDNVEIVMKNMAAEEINFNVDTIAERFVRGDEARNTEGSGLGLAIAKSFVELQGGSFNISVDGDLFKVTIKFNK